jgi:hypothetical protein
MQIRQKLSRFPLLIRVFLGITLGSACWNLSPGPKVSKMFGPQTFATDPLSFGCLLGSRNLRSLTPHYHTASCLIFSPPVTRLSLHILLRVLLIFSLPLDILCNTFSWSVPSTDSFLLPSRILSLFLQYDPLSRKSTLTVAI